MFLEMDRSENNCGNSLKIGQIIYRKIRERNLSEKEITDFLDISADDLKALYKRRSLDISSLIRFSKILDSNLLVYFSDDATVRDLIGQIEELIETVKKQEEELAKLRALNQTHLKVIELLETKDLFRS